MSKFFGNRPASPVTLYDVEPAPPPSFDMHQRAEEGKMRLDHLVTSAERTVATAQEHFASLAASRLRR